MSSRREFLTQVVGSAGALASAVRYAGAAGKSSAASRPLRVLILGGTGHIGPYLVRAAVARSHHVAVFSRGLTDAVLPAGVEHLIGDRNGNLKSIRGRDWDAVVDVATYGPGWVRTLGKALQGHARHYTFISTVSVYDHPEQNKITDETSQVLAYHGSADPYSVTTEGPDYGALKVLSEREAERQFPDRTLIVRPGYVAGPGDTHAPLPYWVLRMQHGGAVLVAGDPSTPVQFIDVRDLAEWIVHMIEKRGTGTYNAVGPIPATDLAGLINAACATAPEPPIVTWVTRSWLLTQKDKELFVGLLFWELNKGSLSGISNARALAHGLTTRAVHTTLADTLRWLKMQPPQQDILLGYRPRPDGKGFEAVRLPWTDYLEREKDIVSAWHAHEQERRAARRTAVPIAAPG